MSPDRTDMHDTLNILRLAMDAAAEPWHDEVGDSNDRG
jgi:hypothetical protein